MARYISRIAKDCRILRADRVELIYNVHGEKYPMTVVQPLIAQFVPGIESTFEKNYAIAFFTGRLVHHPEDDTVSFGDYLLAGEHGEVRLGGANPAAHDTTVAISGPGGSFIQQTFGYDITQKMSTFDTTTQGWSVEDEKLAEELLDLHAGLDYCKLSRTRVAPPWPTYDEMRKSQGAHKSIPAMTRNGGFNPVAVIAYEEQFDDAQKGIIDGLNALSEEAAEKAAEDASLTVVVS